MILGSCSITDQHLLVLLEFYMHSSPQTVRPWILCVSVILNWKFQRFSLYVFSVKLVVYGASKADILMYV